jgi:hypothetical protein
MQGTVTKTQAKKIHKLNDTTMDQAPSIITAHSSYGTDVFVYRRSDLLPKACEVHGGVVGLRSVSVIVDNYYKNAESD